MWVLLRLSMFFLGAGHRFLSLKIFDSDFESYPGDLLITIKNKKGLASGRQISKLFIKIKTKVFFRLVPESSSLRWYKKIGFGRDVEVGAKDFDDMFFIAAENPAVINKLRYDQALRDSLLRLHALGFESFVSDGCGCLVLKNTKTSTENLEPILNDLRQLRDSIEAIPQSSFFSEPLMIWVMAIELFCFGLTTYAVLAEPTFIIDNGRTHLDYWDFFIKGLISVGVVIAGWFALVFLTLRKSSRGPLLVDKFALPFFLVALVAGFELFGDFNQILDTSSASVSEAVVVDKFKISRPTGRPKILHFLKLNFKNNPYNLPDDFQISAFDYEKFNRGDGATFKIRRGFFNCPYLEDLGQNLAPR